MYDNAYQVGDVFDGHRVVRIDRPKVGEAFINFTSLPRSRHKITKAEHNFSSVQCALVEPLPVAKFKKGDIVSSKWGDLVQGTVIDPTPNEQGSITVQWPQWNFFNEYGVFQDNLVLDPPNLPGGLKVGDRVWHTFVQRYGTVVGAVDDPTGPVLVDWDYWHSRLGALPDNLFVKVSDERP